MLPLPLLAPAQAQKHVTHNEALLRLDTLVQLVVEAFDAAIPPPVPEGGQIWALGDAPTGVWAGKGGQMAVWSGGDWQFIPPRDGWRAVKRGETRLRIHAAGIWARPDMDNLAGLGVNATHDTENRLTVASPGTLLSHSGAGHRLKINKAETTETASLLFQSDWSGRAEFGLAGTDDFSIKVSPDGSGWTTALTAGAADGVVDLPAGARSAGHAVLHRGNMVGATAQSGGVPTGSVIERGSNASGAYIRWADGSQICWTVLDLGSATFAGAGSFENPYRTNIAAWTFPAAFSNPPVISGRASVASSTGNDRRMILSTRTVTTTDLDAIQAFRVSNSAGTTACIADLVAIGHWF